MTASGRWRRARRRNDSGSVAAEFAVALPAVFLAVLLGVGALSAAATAVALQDVSADAARLLGRGESNARAAAAVQSVRGAHMRSHIAGDLVCVTATAEVTLGRLIRLPLGASSCALSGGR